MAAPGIDPSTGRDAGFTLLEALVAMAVLAMVVTYFLSTRTTALIDAAETRNWRIAREIAEHHLSELKAGAREVPPESGGAGQPGRIGGSMGTASYVLAGTTQSEGVAFSSASHGAGRAMSRHAARKRWKGGEGLCGGVTRPADHG